MAPTGCSGAARRPSRRARRGRTSMRRRRSPGAWASATRSSPSPRRTRPRSCSRARPAPRPPPIRPSCSPARPIHIAHDFNGQQFKTPSGKLEFYLRAARQAGRLAPARLERGSRRSGRSRQVAAAPADGARLFPGAHGVLGRGLPAPARRQAVLRAASRGRRQARPQERRRGARCSTTAARSA